MAHGLVLRRHDIMEYRRSENIPNEQGTSYVVNNANTSPCDVNLIELWANTVNSSHTPKEFLILLRRTLLFMFSSKWTMYPGKGNLLCVFKYHNSQFSELTDNIGEIYKSVFEIFKKDPWKNSCFVWEDLFDGTLTIYDERVQDYFHSEPEEVVLARVHALVSRQRTNEALRLAKASFLYHSRFAKSFRSSRNRDSTTSFSTKGHASIDWFIYILDKTKSIDFIVNETKQLECHEGVEIVCRLWRDPKNKASCYKFLQIFLIHDLVKPSKYCCTKYLFKLFCLMHEELHSSPKEIAESCHKLFSNFAPSSAHFYLFVDVLWRQFGIKCLDLYVDLYVRGLTADINHLENKRHLESFSDVMSLETHISNVFVKLSRLFKNFSLEIARECMLSAFSLRPSKEKLLVLQRLSQSLSKTNKDIHKSLLDFDFSPDCNCGLRCIGHCRDALNKSSFIHPLLSSSIGNISYILKRDFISVLENVRCVTLQYNVFDWHCNIEQLSIYLTLYSQEKTTWKELDNESSEEICGNSIEDTEMVLDNANNSRCQFDHPSIKRKIDSEFSKETNLPNLEENIAIGDCNSMSKKIKTENLIEVSVTVSSTKPQVKGIDDYVENVIKMSLKNKPAKSWSDNMNFLNVNKDPVLGNANLSRISKIPENLFQSYLTEGNTYNHQVCAERKSDSLHYPDKTHLQISASSAHDHTQQNIAVVPHDKYTLKQMDSCKHQNLSKSNFVHKSSEKTSHLTVAQPVNEAFPNSLSSPKQETRSSQEITNLDFAVNSERERPVHKHHLHSSPFVSSQPPPKSFLKHHLKIHPFGEGNDETLINLTTQEKKDSISCENTRKSVIVNVTGKPLQIPNKLPFPVNSSTIHQNGNSLLKEGSALPLLHVNVPNKYLTKSDVPVNANLIIPYKFDHPVSSSASQTAARDSKVEMVALPGVIAPTSMIKSNPWTATGQSHANTIFPTKISDGTSLALSKVSPKSYKMQIFQPNPSNELTLKRNGSNMTELGISVFKRTKESEDLTKNKLQHTVINEEIAYSSAQLNKLLDPKLQWATKQVKDSSSSQLTFNSISSNQSIPVTTSSQSWYASPYPKTSSNSPVSFSVHKTNIPKTSCNSPVSFSVQNLKTPITNSSSPVSFSVQNMKLHDSFENKNFTYSDTNDPNFSNFNNVQNRPGSSFLKSRLTSVNNVQSYSNVDAYSYANSFSSQEKVYSERNKFSQNQKYPIPERSAHSFVTSANVTTNSIPSHIQSTSVYNPAYSANNQRVVVQEGRNISMSSNVQNTKSIVHPQQCCSPFEVNPCGTCSTKTGNQPFLTKVIGFPSSPVENLHNQVTDGVSSGDKCFEVSKSMPQQIETMEPQKMCTFCSYSFPSSLIKSHMQNVHQELFNTDYNIQNQTLSKETVFSIPKSETMNITNYHSKNENHPPLENNIQNAGNTVLDVENSENADQFISSLLDFIDPNFGKSMEGSYENTGDSQPINSNESACDSSKSESLSEMLKEVDFSRNVSSDLSAICDGNELSYDMIDDKQSIVERFSNENKDNKSWYNNLSLDLLSEDNKSEKKMGSFENSDNSSLGNIYKTNNAINLENKQTSEKLKNPSDMYGTNEPFKQSKLDCIKQELNTIETFSNNSSGKEIINSAIICPICKIKVDVDLQQHINICHPHINRGAIMYNELNSSNTSKPDARSGSKTVFMACNSSKQENPCEIFDFDSYSSDNAAKEIYKPLQKGKQKLYSSNISGNNENVTNIETDLGSQEIVWESLTSKKKGPREICEVCKKVYSKSYMKTHYKKEHMKHLPNDYLKIPENSSNQSLSEQAAISSSTPERNPSFPGISPTLLQEDVDTRTCLSTSDALNSNKKFGSSGIEKISSLNISNRNIQLDQKFPFISVSKEVEVSSVSCLNFELQEESPKTALEERKVLNLKQGHVANKKLPITRTYQCNFSQNGNCCSQNFKTKILFRKHWKDEHTLNYKCNWFQNGNHCNQNFKSKLLLKRHMILEHSCYQCNWSENGNYCNQSFESKALLKKHVKADHALNFKCNWSQNGNYCNQNFKSKLLLKKHLQAEHTLNYKCSWFQDNKYCNQIFPSEPLLFRHLRSEHVRKNSSECDIQQSMMKDNGPTLDRGDQLNENHVFCDSTYDKDSVFVSEVLHKTQISESEYHLSSINLNHEYRKGNDTINSLGHYKSDEVISFSQNELDLPSEQLYPQDLDDQLFEIPDNEDKCQLSPKAMPHLLCKSLVNTSEIISTKKTSIKRSDRPNSINESYEKSFNKDELSDLFNNFKDSTNKINNRSLPQKIYEKYNALSFVSDVKENSENDNLVQNSILDENPSISYDFDIKNLDSSTSVLSLTGNSDTSSKPHNLFSNLLQDFEEANELSSRNETLTSEDSNKYEQLGTDCVSVKNEGVKLDEVVDGKSSENSYDQLVQYPILVPDCQFVENNQNTEVNFDTEILQQNSKLNLTEIDHVFDNSQIATFSEMTQFSATTTDFKINSPKNSNNDLIEFKANLDFQTELTETCIDHKSVSEKNVTVELCIKRNKSALLIDNGPVSNSFPSLSESNDKDVPLFDFKPPLASKNLNEDFQGLGKSLQITNFSSSTHEIPITSDVSFPTDNVAVSSVKTYMINDQEPSCLLDKSITTNTSCDYLEILASEDSKDNENVSCLNKEYPTFSSVESLQNLSKEKEDILDSDIKSISNSASTEVSNISSYKEKEMSVVKSNALNMLSAKDFIKNTVASDKNGTEQCGELMDSGNTVNTQLSRLNSLKKHLLFYTDNDSVQETMNSMLAVINSWENSALLNIENYNGEKFDGNKEASSVLEGKAPSHSSMFINSNCGENNLKMSQLYKRKDVTSPHKMCLNQNTNAENNSSLSCVLCDKVFQSDEDLSDHLKLIHDVPHLKKQISKLRTKINVDKLSPPPLYPNSAYDYDSASTESSPNKYCEEDNSKNVASEEASNSESVSSLLESNSNIYLESSKGIKCNIANEISSECKKEAIIKCKHQEEKYNKVDDFVYSHERKNRKDISNKLPSLSIVSDPHNKDLITKNAALPKCIIKVLKDEQNSVFYKIDNPPEVISECHSKDTLNCADFNSIVLEESSVKYKHIKSYEKLRKRSKKRTLKPKDIRQFLIDNQQPYVLLTRLNRSLINSPNVSTLKPDFTYSNFICKRAKVRIKRLNIPADCLKSSIQLTSASPILGTSSKFLDDIDEEFLCKFHSVKSCRVLLNKMS